MLAACLAILATSLAIVFLACLAIVFLASLAIVFPASLAIVFPASLTETTTLHAQRNGVTGVQVDTGIHSSGPRGVGAVADRSRIERARGLIVRRGWVHRKRQLVHSIDVCDFFVYVFGEHDDFGFVTHPTQTVVTQQSLGQVPDPWLE